MSKPIFDLDKILRPITGNDPCGPCLFYEPVYDRIEEARREDDATLPQGVWEHTLKKADWNRVFTICTETLYDQSKDLQIAVWATEAATMLFGLRGLVEGLSMIGLLADRFWETIYPKFREDDPEIRIVPLEHADALLCQRMLQIPLTQKTALEEQVYTWSDWIDAEHRERVRLQQKSEESGEEKTKILTAVDATPAAFYLGMLDRLNELSGETVRLHEILSGKSGDSAPSFSKIDTEVDTIRDLVKNWLSQRKGVDVHALPEVVTEQKTGEENIMETDREAEQPASTASHVNERMEAYMLLERAAEILVRCEPHSPVPYLIRRLVTWKNKSLAELMEELARREIDLAVLHKLFADRE